MRLLKRVSALFTCVGFAGATLFCVAPACSIPAYATSQDAQIVYDAVENLALETFTDRGLTAEEIAVVSAQAGLSYWYAWVTDASSWSSGNARIYSGFTNYGSTVYFGSGAINDDASTIYTHISDSSNNHISASYTLHDRSLLPRTQLYPSNYVGFGVTGGYGYTLSTTSSYAATSNYDGLWSNDPFSGWLCVGSSPDMSHAVVYNSGNDRGIRFYSGGYDLPGNQYTVSGDFLEDFETLQDDLRETYPDVDPGFYINITIIEDPTEETGCCNCTHNITVNVEPTINVEVNVEPTVNVEVNVENPLPSEWLETIPTETVDNPLEELPTIDVENFTDILQEPDETFPESSGFWWEAFERWIKSNDRLWKYFLGLFTIGVVGFIIRKLG